MSLLTRYKLSRYQFGVDVRKGSQLYGLSGKTIYQGWWISGKTEPIILVEMSKEASQLEAELFLRVNNHPHIIHTLGGIDSGPNLITFVQEFAKHSDLAGLLIDNQFRLTAPTFIEMFSQIANAMSYVVKKRIVHGDLGCRNVLVFRVDPTTPKNNLVKITDFGLARSMDQPPANDSSPVIPIRFCAPEILCNPRHGSYSEKSDVYSMGVLVWEALSNGAIPYSSIADDNDVVNEKLDDVRLERPPLSNDSLWSLMNNCWETDKKKRPTFAEIEDNLLAMQFSNDLQPVANVSSPRINIRNDYQLNADIRIAERLHQGSLTVYAAEWVARRERAIVVVERETQPSECETLIYTHFPNHRYIIHTYGSIDSDRGTFMLAQERAPHGDLQSLLTSGTFKPSQAVLVRILMQINEAMIDLAEKGLVHGDLQCSNVYVFEMHPTDPDRNHVKVGNFATARWQNASIVDAQRTAVPVRYCAPEILRSAGQSNYNESSDVYAFGVLIWQACSYGRVPYESTLTSGEVRQRKLNGEKLPNPLGCDARICQVMEYCCYGEPQIRFQFKEIKILLTYLDQAPPASPRYELTVNVFSKAVLDLGHGMFYEANCTLHRDRALMLRALDDEFQEREARMYLKLNASHHIVYTFGIVLNDLNRTLLLQERAAHGNLQTLLHRDGFQPTAPVIKVIFLQLIKALLYLSGEDMVHGDVCCANVLVFAMHATQPMNNRVKLTNFRSTRRKGETSTEVELPVGSHRHLAPEIATIGGESNYSEASDVYAFGVTLWEVFAVNDDHVLGQVREGEKLPQPKKCPDALWYAIEGCTLLTPEIRHSLPELATYLAKTRLEIVQYQQCNRCRKRIVSSEMNVHRQSCPRPRSPVVIYEQSPAISKRKAYGSNDDDHRNSREPRGRSKLPRIDLLPRPHSPTAVVRMNDRSPSVSPPPPQRREPRPRPPVSNRQERRPNRDRPRPPIISQQPQRIFIQCKHCHEDFSNEELDVHEETCRGGKPIPTHRENVIRRENTTNKPKDTPQSKSIWQRFQTCFCC